MSLIIWPGHGMKWKMERNGNIGIKYGRCQNGMEVSLPYQFHTRFCSWHFQKNIYRS